MTAFKTSQHVIVMSTDCNGHRNTIWFQRDEQARDNHLRNCWYKATVKQIFEPDPLTKRPRYLLDNTYHVAIFDECRLVDCSNIS